MTSIGRCERRIWCLQREGRVKFVWPPKPDFADLTAPGEGQSSARLDAGNQADVALVTDVRRGVTKLSRTENCGGCVHLTRPQQRGVDRLTSSFRSWMLRILSAHSEEHEARMVKKLSRSINECKRESYSKSRIAGSRGHERPCSGGKALASPAVEAGVGNKLGRNSFEILRTGQN